MPFRLDEFRAKIQFVTSSQMPHLIYKACLRTNTASNTRYIQEAVCEKLARDLDMPLQDLLDALPPCRTAAAALWDGSRRPVPRPLCVRGSRVRQMRQLGTLRAWQRSAGASPARAAVAVSSAWASRRPVSTVECGVPSV